MERDEFFSWGLFIVYISTHTLTWSVTFVLNVAGGGSNHFNSHAHVERDLKRHRFMTEKINFNSHAHVERDFKFIGYHSYQKISTHTLTWSVTR